MLYKNLTVKELYASIPATNVIESFFLKGLEMDNDRLAVSAMEELILRDNTDKVFRGLSQAFERGDVRAKTTTANMIARSLKESCRGGDYFLYKFGEFLLEAEGPNPFREFLEGDGRKALFKSGSKELLGLCSKYVTLERPMDLETAINAGLIAQELKRTRETKERLQKLSDDSFLEWMKVALSDSGVDQSVIDKWLSEMTPDQLAKLKKDVMDCSE